MTESIRSGPLLFAGIQDLAQGRRERSPSKDGAFAEMLGNPPSKIPGGRERGAAPEESNRGWRLAGDISHIRISNPAGETLPSEEAGTPEPDAHSDTEVPPVVIPVQEPAAQTSGIVPMSDQDVPEQDLPGERQRRSRDLPARSALGGIEVNGMAPSMQRGGSGDTIPRQQLPPAQRESMSTAVETASGMPGEPEAERDIPAGRRSVPSAPLNDSLKGESFGRGPAEPAIPQMRLVSAQSVPVPPQILSGGGSTPGAAVLAALEANPGFAAAASEAAHPIAQGQTQPGETLHTLKIQLQPAELGAVTARLTLQGSQLMVELQVETSEARQKLNADSEAMTRALRAMGYEVDRITIQQAPNTANSPAGGGTAGRDAGFQAGTGGGQQGSGTGQARDDGSGGGRRPAGDEAEKRQDAGASGSLYI